MISFRSTKSVKYNNIINLKCQLKYIQKQLESDEQYKNGNILIEYSGNHSYMEIDEYEYFVAILIAVECPYDPKISI